MKHKFSRIRSTVLLLAGILAASLSAYSQVSSPTVLEDWNTISGTQNNFQRSIIRSKALGGATYYYTCGSTLNSSGNYDILIQKKNASGLTLWSQTYNGAGSGNDYGADVQISTTGSVYVCGTYYKDATDSNNAIIIKYNAAGTQQWAYTYNGAGSRHDIFAAMQISTNAVVAVGTTYKGSTNLYDILATRIDTSGSHVWTQTWDYANLNDCAVNLWNSGTKIYIAGGAQSAATTYKYAVVNVKFSDGSIQGSTTTGGTAFGYDQLTDIQYDLVGNIYVTGGVLDVSTGYDMRTVKLDSALNILWSATYNGAANLNDIASGLTVDSLGNVIITGYTTTTTQNKNYATVKYNSSGTQQWVATYNGSANGNDSATAIVSKGIDIYVTGASANVDGFDYYTIKYDDSGNLKWQMSWNSASNYSDRALAIAVDSNRAVVITGQTQINPTTYVYTTVRFVERNVLVPTDLDGQLTSFCYTANRGQLRGTNSEACNQIKFYNKNAGSQQQIYLADTALHYVWAHQPDSIQTNDSIIRLDMTLVGDNNNRKIQGMNERTDYMNYFQGYLDQPYARIKNYDRLFSYNVYNNIDMVYGSNGAGMRYYYVVKPGGSPTSIAEKYTGATSVAVNGSGSLVITTLFGTVTHPKPRVWQVDGSGNISTLAWQPTWSVTGSTATMSFGSFNSSEYLIIEIYNGPSVLPQQDPTDNLEWSMHFGSMNGGNAYFYAVRTDKYGNSFYGGASLGNNFPVFNSIFGGPYGPNVYDALLVGIDTLDRRIFSTYYGGSDLDAIWGIDTDTLGYVYFTGVTASTDLEFPFFPPALSYYDLNYNGGTYDMMVGKISTTGTQHIWSTYYGGSLDDQGKTIYYNQTNGRLYVSGYTGSSNFPLRTKTGAYNASSGYAAIVEFDQNLDTTWAVQFGNLGDQITGIDGDGQNTFVVGQGSSFGSGIPVYDPGSGAYYDATATSDAFILRFNAADTITWGTGFGGSGTDGASGLCLAGNKDLYVVGSTSSTYPGFPLQFLGTEYIDSVASGSEGFIVRFSVTGGKKWCSFYGDNGSDNLRSITADDNKTVYVLGQTTSTGISLLSNGNAYYQAYNGTGVRADALILSFDPMNQRLWATCYGGPMDEVLTGNSHMIANFGNEKLFITGYSTSTGATFPWDYTYANSWIDTTKTNVSETTPFCARLNISAISVGLNEATAQQTALLLYPNPTAAEFTVQIPELTGNTVEIRIYDVTGQIVEYRKRENIFGTLEEPFDLSLQANGVYFVSVIVDQQELFSGKIIKQD